MGELFGTDWPEYRREKTDFCPKFVPRAGRASRRGSGSLCKSIGLAAGSVDDLRVVKPLQFSRKKGLLLVSNPMCFVFLRMVAGVGFEPTTFGL